MPYLEEGTHQELLPAAGQNQTHPQQPSQLPLPTRFDGTNGPKQAEGCEYVRLPNPRSNCCRRS